ncbi:hypothetical protein FHETE_10427 [Fusarium heterosporum]|uniref:PA14 domain-containing protein n=1 Tax=Fusarium heterosporum TaxID=42747 RepID=A0A8H5SV97_FUSHE|nr:hypothetical protein FHETE_10427 [Fusarium heterosporum]
MNSKTLVCALACLSVSGVYAGPCKPATTSAAVSTQVTSATTEESSVVDVSTTIIASDTTTAISASSTDSSETSEGSTAEISTTIAAATTETTTTEVAPTTTAPGLCATPVPCDNLGFDWAYYANPAQNTDTTYSNFHPASFKDTNPIYVGTTRKIGGLYQGSGANTQGPIYDSTTDLSLDYFALNHHGYFYACESGTYKFEIPYANDAVYLWLGSPAYASWSENNANAKARYNQPDHIAGSASFEVDLPADVYIPIRLVYGQAQYGGGFTFTITSPSGQVLAGNDVVSSPLIVRYSCDGINAPQYLPFGQEV